MKPGGKLDPSMRLLLAAPSCCQAPAGLSIRTPRCGPGENCGLSIRTKEHRGSGGTKRGSGAYSIVKLTPRGSARIRWTVPPCRQSTRGADARRPRKGRQTALSQRRWAARLSPGHAAGRVSEPDTIRQVRAASRHLRVPPAYLPILARGSHLSARSLAKFLHNLYYKSCL